MFRGWFSRCCRGKFFSSWNFWCYISIWWLRMLRLLRCNVFSTCIGIIIYWLYMCFYWTQYVLLESFCLLGNDLSYLWAKFLLKVWEVHTLILAMGVNDFTCVLLCQLTRFSKYLWANQLCSLGKWYALAWVTKPLVVVWGTIICVHKCISGTLLLFTWRMYFKTADIARYYSIYWTGILTKLTDIFIYEKILVFFTGPTYIYVSNVHWILRLCR